MSFVISKLSHSVGSITLNHPEKHNCLNPAMISDMLSAYRDAEKNDAVKVILLSANGKNFCSGADVAHMKKMGEVSNAENLSDAKAFVAFFHAIYRCKKPTICYVHGKVLGGGIGLMAAHDIVVATEDVEFSFPEVKIGLMPATIAPFVVQRMGFQQARRYMLSTEFFSSKRACDIGLVDMIGYYAAAEKYAMQLIENGLPAMKNTKAWLQELCPISPDR